jgi:AcrR family transcriptional regulator
MVASTDSEAAMAEQTLVTPLRRHARANREKILDVARRELTRNPEVSMDDIAHAAGLARRTIYGHFPTREELARGLAQEALDAILSAFRHSTASQCPADEQIARFTSDIWDIGDKYRLLMALAQRALTRAGVADLLAPVRTAVSELIAEGQADGVFATDLPAAVLSDALAAFTLTLLEAQDSEAWAGDSQPVVTAVLVAAGVSHTRAKLLGARTSNIL